jgi:hypothetical protein
MHVVPISDFDLAWHERAIRHSGKDRFEDDDGEVFPSDESHAANKKRIAEVKRGLAKLTAAQRRSSRWPSKIELKKALEYVRETVHGELSFGPNTGPWRQGSVEVYNDDRSMITGSVRVNTSSDGTYYCEAHADMLHVFANAVARFAGPQVTFLGDDYSPAEFTSLIVPEMRAKKTKTTKTATKAKTTRTATKAKTTTKAKSKPR